VNRMVLRSVLIVLCTTGLFAMGGLQNQNSPGKPIVGNGAAGRGDPGGGGAGTSGSLRLRGRVLPKIPDIKGVTDDGKGHIQISSPRPLEVAAEFLRRKSGLVVSYEEPAWMSAQDTVLAGDLPENRGLVEKYPTWRGNLVPREGSLNVFLPDSHQLAKANNLRNVIEDILANHISHRNAGDFKLAEVNGTFDILADKVTDESGRMIPAKLPLDTVISFENRARSLADTIDVICAKVRESSGIPVISTVNMTAAGYLNEIEVQIGANNEVARSVLARAFRGGSLEYSWHVDYLPDEKLFVLGAVAVQAETDTPQGLTLLIPAWPK